MADLRRWLQKSPHPERVRAELADGEEKTVVIGDSRSKWRDAEAALSGAVSAEALDKSGATLRVWESEDADEQRATKQTARSKEENLVVLIAQLLEQAADRAVSRHAEIVHMAFDQQAQLCNAISARNAALEKAWHQLVMSQQPDENAAPDPNAGMMLALAQLAMSGVPQAAKSEPPAQPSNGAK